MITEGSKAEATPTSDVDDDCAHGDGPPPVAR